MTAGLGESKYVVTRLRYSQGVRMRNPFDTAPSIGAAVLILVVWWVTFQAYCGG